MIQLLFELRVNVRWPEGLPMLLAAVSAQQCLGRFRLLLVAVWHPEVGIVFHPNDAILDMANCRPAVVPDELHGFGKSDSLPKCLREFVVQIGQERLWQAHGHYEL